MSSSSLLAVGLGALLLGCSSSEEPGGDGGLTPGTVVDAGRYSLTVLAPGTPDTTCDPHASAVDGGLQFSDTTSQWGIASDGGFPLQGTSFVVADLDEDGYPDLIATNGFSVFAGGRETIPTLQNGALSNVDGGGFSTSVAVLMNRPNPAGGRMFVDASQDSGLFQIRGGSTTQLRQITVATVGDINNDGTPDILTSIVNPPANGDVDEVMLNDGTGHFTFATPSDPSNLEQPDQFPQGLTMTDVDNDGLLDVYEAFWYNTNHTFYGDQQRLYHGNGDGTFNNIASTVGLSRQNYDASQGSLSSSAQQGFLSGQNSHPAQGVTACDLDGDGFPELIESSYGQQWNTLYQNNGAGTSFADVAQTSGYAGDANHDYHDNQYFLCFCADPSNKTSADCAGVAAPSIQCPQPIAEYWDPTLDGSPADTNANGFATVCRDMFGTGRNDLYTANIKHWWDGQSIDESQLMTNQTQNGTLMFSRLDNAADGLKGPDLGSQGWNEGFQGAFATDLDNDGRPDFVIGQSDYPYQWALTYLQQPDQTFEEMHTSLGVQFPCAIGLAAADFDRDGSMDLIFGGSLARDCAASGGGWAAIPGKDPGFPGYTVASVGIFSGNASQSTSWLELRLKGDGTTTNTMGIGAKVTLTVNGASQMQEMQSTFGHAAYGNDIGVLFWGLGSCDNIDSIQVRWPNGNLGVDTYKNVPSNHFIELHQGDPTLYQINLAN